MAQGPIARAWAALWAGRPLRELLGLHAVILLAGALWPLRWWDFFTFHRQDLEKYWLWSDGVLAGGIPYRDFPYEYPPLALVSFVLPRLPTLGAELEFPTYCLLFLAQNVALSVGVAWLLYRYAGRRGGHEAGAAALMAYTAFAALDGQLLVWRFDLLPAAMTLLAFMAATRGRAEVAGLWIGAAIATKLYPLVLVPIFALYCLRGGAAKAAGFLAGTAAALVATVLPVWYFAHGKLATFLAFHQARGLQIESLPAAFLSLLDVFGRAPEPVKTVANYGAIHLNTPTADALARLTTPAFLVVGAALVALVAWRFRAEARAGRRVADGLLAAAIVATLLVFIVTNKVFSPQYVFWLLPFLPMLAPRERRVAAVVVGLTTLIYPFIYIAFMELAPGPIVIVNVRNALVLLFLGAITYRLARGEAGVTQDMATSSRYNVGPAVAPAERP
jgi:hypothetical protein